MNAITHEVSPSIQHCQLTHLTREVIDVEAARLQHSQYQRCLANLGCDVHCLPVRLDLPDSVFVEDTAVVLDELAVIMRPGPESRRPETESVAKALEPHRELRYIESPGTIEGGDVMQIGRKLFVGLSGRTNAAGIEQLRAHVLTFGYTVEAVDLKGCLHLKTAVCPVARNTLLINRTWIDTNAFTDMELIDVDPSEPFGANALWVGQAVIYPLAYQATQKRMEDRGIIVETVDASELAKAEGGVTCCSLIFNS
ncbi:MAG: dimethylarginine dimethylaminohydrolase family protein [Planctomycetota bacterium]|jgi:dimethylargininase